MGFHLKNKSDKEGYKKCSKCGEELPLTNEYFYTKSNSSDKLWSECKRCWKTERNDTKNNRKKANEYARNLHARNRNKEKEWAEKYRETDKFKMNAALYREANRFHKNKYNHFYRKTDNGKKAFKMYISKRKLIMDSLEFSYTKEQWSDCKSYFNCKCAYCGKEAPLTQDHFLALSKGGEYTINNILPSCKSCNSSKRDKDFFEWYPKYKYYSKKRESIIFKYLRYEGCNQQLIII